MSANTYRMRSGDLVTSKNGTWPTQYVNRTQATRAAEQIPGAYVIQPGRVFYVVVPEPEGAPARCPVTPHARHFGGY